MNPLPPASSAATARVHQTRIEISETTPTTQGMTMPPGALISAGASTGVSASAEASFVSGAGASGLRRSVPWLAWVAGAENLQMVADDIGELPHVVCVLGL